MKVKIFIICLFFFVMANQVFADVIFKDNFQDSTKWKYISDDVMGGVSTGSIVYEMSEGHSIAYLSGDVSTENNGGFIQVQRKLKDVNLEKAKYIKIIAKGNNQKYFIHLRTRGTILPWQYYAFDFVVTENYKEFIIPISEFKKSGSFLANKVKPKSIKSVGIVAFGRDHEAKLHVKEIAFLE